MSRGWLYRSWVSKELPGGRGGPQTLCMGRTPSRKVSVAAGMGMVPVLGVSRSWMPSPVCSHQLKLKGDSS